jgi:hypothetical protein
MAKWRAPRSLGAPASELAGRIVAIEDLEEMAVVAWTKPRATRDADLWVDLSHGRRELERALGDAERKALDDAPVRRQWRWAPLIQRR